MDTTLVIAKIIGIYFAVSGLFVVMKRKTLGLILKDMFDHRAITFLVGIMLLLGGSALVMNAQDGEDGLSIFVKVISWAILVKGLFYIFIPEWVRDMNKNISKPVFTLIGAVITIVGLYLIFFLPV